jgi:hypothetical protein
VLQLDKFGLLLKKWTGKKGTLAGEGMVTALLELTGKAATSWGGGDKSAGRLESVQNPCVAMFAVSTPHSFWGALETGAPSTACGQ